MGEPSPAGERRPSWRLTALPAELAGIAALTAMLLSLAWWNGFPFLFYDTGAYMYQGFTLVPSPDRSPVYSLFLRYGGGQADLWRVAVLQCLITAVVVVEFARAVHPRTSLWRLLAIGALLMLATSAAFVAAQIEPDFLTPVLVLALYPLAFHLRRLGLVRTIVLLAAAGLATAGHPSHLGICGGLVLALALLRLTVRHGFFPKPNLLLPALSFGLGLGLVLQANYVVSHSYFVSRSAPFFFAARLLADGSALQTLDEICPERHLVLCPYRDQIGTNADVFLWSMNTPFDKTGRFAGPAEDYALLVRETLRRHPFWAAGGLLLQGVVQFFQVRSGDSFPPVQRAVHSSFVNHVPQQVKAYLAARQQQDRLHLLAVNVVHLPLALAALWWLGKSLRYGLRTRRRRAVLAAYLLVALVGNAAICGMISGAHDRYQSRLIWIVPFALMLTEGRAIGDWLHRRRWAIVSPFRSRV